MYLITHGKTESQSKGNLSPRVILSQWKIRLILKWTNSEITLVYTDILINSPCNVSLRHLSTNIFRAATFGRRWQSWAAVLRATWHLPVPAGLVSGTPALILGFLCHPAGVWATLACLTSSVLVPFPFYPSLQPSNDKWTVERTWLGKGEYRLFKIPVPSSSPHLNFSSFCRKKRKDYTDWIFVSGIVLSYYFLYAAL